MAAINLPTDQFASSQMHMGTRHYALNLFPLPEAT